MDQEKFFNNCLLIEDDEVHAMLIRGEVEKLVGELNRVATGAEANLWFDNNGDGKEPDLILCDLNLPDIWGVELIKQLKARYPLVAIIVLTSSANLNDVVEAMNAGAWDYMVKDFGLDFVPRFSISLRRSHERRQRMIREHLLLKERNAFWLATQLAPYGVGLVDDRGDVMFRNQVFEEFCVTMQGAPLPAGQMAGHKSGTTHVGSNSTSQIESLGAESPSESLNIVKLVHVVNPALAERIAKHLGTSGKNAFWSTEICTPSSQTGADITKFYELAIISNAEQFKGGLLEERITANILWLEDITETKRREAWQRDLLNTTTHDLKGPLGAIMTATELITDDLPSLNTTSREMLLRILSCARSATNIIDEFLSATRIRDNVFVIKPREFDVVELLDEIVSEFHPIAVTRKIELKAGYVTERRVIRADRLALKRGICNLVSNSLKFTRGGSVILGLEVGENLCITVTDTGIGIDPAALHKLFERYGRIESSGEFEGTGLGLFVTKKIVEAHEGRIEVVTEPGKGSIFSIILPRPLVLDLA